MTERQNPRPRILSGMRPTGKLHLGNLVGALQNWVKLQDEYESYHFVADWHMLTTDYADPSEVRENTLQMVTDWLATGLDPNKATFFVQSRLPEHAELHLLFSMITPLSWLERVPTYKEQLENITDRDIHTYGFLGYPLLQAADILMYKADAVPVGEDQVPHVELTREVARRFNQFYGRWDTSTQFDSDAALGFIDSSGRKGSISVPGSSIQGSPEEFQKALGIRKDIFPEPQALLTPSPRLPGTDGRKMSKSYGNAIFLTDAPDLVSKKLATMITDPARKRRSDPGNPDVCPVYDLHKIFSKQETISRVNRECRTAGIGCLDCKKLLAGHVNETLAPIRERRQQYERHPELVWHVLDDGTKKARKVAKDTMRQVRRAMSLAAPEKGHVDEFLFFEVAHSKLNPPQIGAMQELHDYFRAAAKGKRWARSNGDLRFIAEFSDIATKLTYNLITDGVLTIKLKPLSDAHEAYRKRSEFRSVLEGIGRNRLRDGWEVLTHSFAVSQWQDHVSNLVKATVHLCGEGAPRAKVPDGLPNDYD